MKRRLRSRERGVAIVTALLLTTLAVTIVGSLFWQQQVQVRSIENQRLQLQKQWILRGALDWTRLILRADGVISTVDHLDEPWAVPLAETRLDQYVENGQADDASDATLSGGIVDAQARFNLGNLVQNGQVQPTEVAAFRRLLGFLQLNPGLAQATAELMMAAQKKTANTGGGSGSAATAPASDSSSPQPMDLVYVDDLLAVPGFTPEILAKLRDYVVVLPGIKPINVNTAPAEVLAARIDTLSLSDAAALVASRKNAWFKDPGDFTQRMQGKQLGSGTNQIAVSTNYFLVNGHVRLSRAGMDMQALVERTGGRNPKVTVLWIRED